MAEPSWYLVFTGSSVDGRGIPEFRWRTTDKEEALKFFRTCVSTPYDFGHIAEVTDKTYTRIHG